MKKDEPPPSNGSNSSLFLIGKDSHGHWVVRDQSGLRGGLFVNRVEALKFAMFENGNRPQAAIMVSGVLELDMNVRRRANQRATVDMQNPLQRVA